jgi:hypothetical protein
MGYAIDPFADRCSNPLTGEQVVDRPAERGSLAPHRTERDAALGVDQADRCGEPAIRPLHGAVEVVDEHRPGDAFLLLIADCIIELLGIGDMRTAPLAWVRLANDHVDELNPLPVEAVKLFQRQNSAARQRSGVADEMQQDRPAAKGAQAQSAPAGGLEVEVGRRHARNHVVAACGAEQFGEHVAEPEVAKVEVVDRIEACDQACGPVGSRFDDGCHEVILSGLRKDLIGESPDSGREELLRRIQSIQGWTILKRAEEAADR